MAGARIQLKRATASAWAAANTVLFAGEIGLETDTNKFKIGNGSTAFNSLPYFNGNLVGSNLNDLADVTITSAADGDFLRWNGTAWINDAVNLSTDTIGSYVESLVAGTGVTLTNNSGEAATPTVAIGQAVGTSSSVTFANVTAPLTGNASTASALQTARTISLSGDVSGSVSFNGSSNVDITATVQPNSVALGTDTTGNYMAGVTAGTGIQVSHTPGEGSDATISIGQDVGTGQSVTFAGATIDAIKIGVTNANTIDTTSGNLTIDSSGGTVTIADNLIVDGTLTVSGSVAYVNTTNLQVGDNIITLNVDETGSPSQNAGIEVERGTSTNVLLQYNETSDKWELTNDGSSYSPIETTATVGTSLNQQLWLNTVYAATTGVLPNSPSYTAGTTDLNGGTGIGAKLTATTNGTFELDGAPVPLEDRILVKNQANALHNGIYKVTATGSASATWELTRAADFNNSTFGQTIYGKSVRVATGSVNALQVFAVTSYGSVSLNGLESMIHVIGTDSITWTQVSGKATLIPGNGLQITNNELSLPTINQSNTASTSGATNFVKGVSVDSYGRLLGVTTNDVLLGLGTNTVGDYVQSISASAGTGLTVTGTGEGAVVTVSSNATSANTASAIVMRDGAGNFSAGTITAELSGNASTANTLYASKSIGLTGDLSGSVSFNGSQDVVISATIQPNSVALGTDTSGDYVSSLIAGTGIVLTNNSGESATPTVALDATLDNLSNVTVPSPTSGDFLKWNGTAWVNDAINLGTDTTGNYMSDLTQGTGITITHTPGEGSNATIAIGQSVATTASVTFANVTADLVGNVTGNVTGSSGSTTGNAATATTLQTSRTIELTGDVTGSASFNGSANASISATIAANSVALGTDTTGNYLNDLTAGTGVTVTHTPGEGSSPTVAIGQAVGTSASVTFADITATGTVTLAADPSSALQAATKQYVDNIVSGINFHESVVASTTANLAGTYANGTAGVGATLTKASNGAIGAIDGVTVAVGNRVLVKSQTDVKQNGIYTVTTVGDAGTPWVITRATDADNSVTGEMKTGDFCFVMGGSTNAGYGFINNSATNPIVIGTDNITYSAFNAAQTLTNGSGINLVSNVLSVDTTTIQARVADVSDTEIGYLNGVTSAIQTQMDAKAPLASPTFTGTVTLPTGTVTSAMILDGTIVNADIDASAAIALSKLATSTAGNIIVYNSSGVPTSVTESGDVTISDTGVTAIASGVIVNADISATAAIDLGKLADVSTNAQTASYTLVLADKNKVVEMGVGSANNLTVPLNSSVAFPVGSQINILQTGAGQTTIVATGGVTINATPGLKMRAQWSYATLIKRATDTWVLVGDISA